ncbi:MAG: hypothetical protein OXU22_09435 [Gammaproteobacteria bacterium]|nr:hypothetical protein [Gammaproteobacteria bacterium]
MTAATAAQASGHMAMHSPQPSAPPVVCKRTRTVIRAASWSFGSG